MAKHFLSLGKVSLAHLLVRLATGNTLIAWQHHQPVYAKDFLVRVAAWRDTVGCLPGKRWALYNSDTVDFAAALLGLWAAERIPVLPGDVLPATVTGLCHGDHAVDGFIGQAFSNTMTDQGEKKTVLVQSVTTNSTTDASCFSVLDSDNTWFEVFTSGSTSAPVAIRKKLWQMEHELETLEALFGVAVRGSVIRATVSHQHIYGLTFRLLWPLAAGHVFDAHILPYQEMIAACAKEGDFTLISSPAHLKRLSDGYDWSLVQQCLRKLFSAGGALPAEAIEQCHVLLGKMPTEIYGSSEAGGIAYRIWGSGKETWTRMPGVKVSVHQDEILCLQSRHMPDENPFITADRIKLHQDGSFDLLGRIDRIVKIEEKRISLTQIEECLTALPYVKQGRVFALENKSSDTTIGMPAGVRLAAVVVPTEQGNTILNAQGKKALNDLLRRHLSQHIEAIALPRRWRYVPALPENGMGKITQTELEALFMTKEKPRQPDITEVSRTDQQVVMDWRIPRDLAWFEGHFPQAPVLAGVVQLDWVVALGRKYFPLAPDFLSVEALKFQHIIHPGHLVRVTLSLRCKEEDNQTTLSFRIDSQPDEEKRCHASGRIVFGSAQ